MVNQIKWLSMTKNHVINNGKEFNKVIGLRHEGVKESSLNDNSPVNWLAKTESVESIIYLQLATELLPRFQSDGPTAILELVITLYVGIKTCFFMHSWWYPQMLLQMISQNGDESDGPILG